ncbi:MAG: hypothetical protein HF962_03055 [Sulfurovum sp.]|nr:hypothetical protein [Sulfurovum sp.]
MNEKLFVPIMEYDSIWSMRGFSHQHFSREYSRSVLKIPNTHIKNCSISEKGLDIELQDVEKASSQRWYIHLKSITR